MARQPAWRQRERKGRREGRERLHKLIPGVYTGILGTFLLSLKSFDPAVFALVLAIFGSVWFARVFGSRAG